MSAFDMPASTSTSASGVSMPGNPGASPAAQPLPRPRQALRRLLLAVLPYRLHLLGAFAGMGVIAATEPAVVWIVKYLVDHGFEDATSGRRMLWIPAALVLAFALRGIAGFAIGYLMIWVSSSMLVCLQSDVYRAALAADPQVDSMQLGQAINAVVVEGRNALELVERVLIKFFRSLFSVLALTLTLVQIHPQALWLLSFAIPFIWTVRSTGRQYEVAANGYVASNSRFAECAEEVLLQADLVGQYGAQEFEAGRLDLLGNRINRAYRRMLSIAGLMVPATQAIIGCFLATLFWLRPSFGQGLTDGEFIALATTLMLMMVPLRDLAEVNGALLRGVVGALAVFSSVDLEREPSGVTPYAATDAPSIEFSDLTLHPMDVAEPVLNCIGFTVPAGGSVALVGPCGSGKSSILKLIAGLARPTQGSVRIGGTCISQLDLVTLRAKVSFVSQEAPLFDDSIAFNVSYGDAEPDIQRMWTALREAQLAAFVVSLPEGAQTRIGRGGVQLSGGQRQLLAVARAFYRDAPIVLLDEPSAALDAESEHLLADSLARLMRGRSTLIVTHRRAIMGLADRVLRVEHGQLLTGTRGGIGIPEMEHM